MRHCADGNGSNPYISTLAPVVLMENLGLTMNGVPSGLVLTRLSTSRLHSLLEVHGPFGTLKHWLLVFQRLA